MNRDREKTTRLVIHCSATPPKMDIGTEEIHQWHIRRGIKSPRGSLTGYHGVIRRDGTLEYGREMMEIGAHCRGINQSSVGVCLVGGIESGSSPPAPEDNFTLQQMHTLVDVIRFCRIVWPDIKIIGHTEYNNRKACPCFDVQEFLTSWRTA